MGHPGASVAVNRLERTWDCSTNFSRCGAAAARQKRTAALGRERDIGCFGVASVETKPLVPNVIG